MKMAERIFTNAIVVLSNEVISGTVAVSQGVITDISHTQSALPMAEYIGGDYLLPGLVELHTDNLEKHIMPRSGVKWPSISAVVSHDRQVVAAGITTVFNAISVGDIAERSDRIAYLKSMVDGLKQATNNKLLTVEHRLHLRCEISFPDFEKKARAVRPTRYDQYTINHGSYARTTPVL